MQAMAKVAEALSKIEQLTTKLAEKEKEVEQLKAELGLATELVGPIQELMQQIKDSEEEDRQRAIQEAASAIESERAALRGFIKQIAEISADDTAFRSAVVEYRRIRGLPNESDEDAANQETEALPLAEVG